MKDAAYFMKRALICAKKAASLGGVPVGAVVVRHRFGLQPSGNGEKRPASRGNHRSAPCLQKGGGLAAFRL